METGFTQAGNFTHILNAQHSLAVGWDLELRRREEKREITELGLAQIADLEGQPFSARVERSAGYVQDEWQISPQWFTYFGLRGERIATRSEGMSVDVNNISTVITPMWHVNYKLDAAGKDIIRGSITRSYKAPELGTLLARPSVSGLFADLSKTNAELSPDRVG
ncbi:MAG: TonB-dependent receptor, partial [Betaproteobacteria bacterium]|nr:TonB-dependent receptor [Betaproteobacteria bacterium]